MRSLEAAIFRGHELAAFRRVPYYTFGLYVRGAIEPTLPSVKGENVSCGVFAAYSGRLQSGNERRTKFLQIHDALLGIDIIVDQNLGYPLCLGMAMSLNSLMYQFNCVLRLIFTHY